MKKRLTILHDSFLQKNFPAGIQLTETSSIGGEYRPSFHTKGGMFLSGDRMAQIINIYRITK